MTEDIFPDNDYAQAALDSGDELTRKALAFLDKRGRNGKEYMETTIHQESNDVFERLFAEVDDVKQDFALYVFQIHPCPECTCDSGYWSDEGELRCDRCGEVQEHE